MARPQISQMTSTPDGINIEAWTAGAASSVPMSTSIFSNALAERPLSRHLATVTLDISIDAEPEKSAAQQRRETKILKNRVAGHENDSDSDEGRALSGHTRRHTSVPRRRDSLKRREALLKGKEGSRRRQKWENDRLLGNPAFQPPEPHDWAPHPTHPVQSVPYVLAPLWDEGYGAASRARVEQARQSRRAAQRENPAAQVPRELREKLKRARGAKSLLQDLEEQVREFVRQWEEDRLLRSEGWDTDVTADVDVEDETEEEEIVFVGRTKQKRDKAHARKNSAELRRDKLVFDSLVDDQGASFGRWLVHSIASYYNLRTWSVTTGDPARREAYVGIPDARLHSKTSTVSEMGVELPRPLWVMV